MEGKQVAKFLNHVAVALNWCQRFSPPATKQPEFFTDKNCHHEPNWLWKGSYKTSFIDFCYLSPGFFRDSLKKHHNIVWFFFFNFWQVGRSTYILSFRRARLDSCPPPFNLAIVYWFSSLEWEWNTTCTSCSIGVVRYTIVQLVLPWHSTDVSRLFLKEFMAHKLKNLEFLEIAILTLWRSPDWHSQCYWFGKYILAYK